MATGGGSMGATCRGTRRRIGGASRLCQVARSCSYVLDGLRSWLRDRCSVLGVNRREGPLSEGSDRGKIENGGCASLARVSSRARWAPRSRSLDPRLLRRSRLLESLALAFDRSSLGIANGRSVRGLNYVNRNLIKQEEKSPEIKVLTIEKFPGEPGELGSIESDMLCSTLWRNLQSNLSTLNMQIASNQWHWHKSRNRSQSQQVAKRKITHSHSMKQEKRKKFHKF